MTGFLVLLGCCFRGDLVPCAAAGSEWIKDDQQGELSEALAEFRTAGFHLFACGNPAQQGQASGALCLLTLFGHANKVRRLAGRNPPNLILRFI